MALYCSVLRATSVVLNLLCSFILPIVEGVAHKLRIGCECESQSSQPERRSKRKKVKSNGCASSEGVVTSENCHQHYYHGHDGKRLKLLVDITVRQVGDQTVDIKETTRYVVEDDKTGGGIVARLFGAAQKLINLPSSTVLYTTEKIRQWTHDLESLENTSCGGDPNRIKKSPKRRICRANYRKIIPFFPFNLLGFSNYSAFQMPTLTGCNVATGTDDLSQLNISNISAGANGKARSKRRRHSSTDNNSSDDDFSHLEISEIQKEQPLNESGAGHDEVDSNSDESPETVTKAVTSSSSNETGQGTSKGTSNGKITFKENQNQSRDNADSNTSSSSMGSEEPSAGAEGAGNAYTSTFSQELDEAANESYNSATDPDYKPDSTSEGSSLTSDTSGVSESFLKSNSNSPEKTANKNRNGNVGGENDKQRVKESEEREQEEKQKENEQREGEEVRRIDDKKSLSLKQESLPSGGDDGEGYKTPEEEHCDERFYNM